MEITWQSYINFLLQKISNITHSSLALNLFLYIHLEICLLDSGVLDEKEPWIFRIIEYWFS